jgi:hypothetical protein
VRCRSLSPRSCFSDGQRDYGLVICELLLDAFRKHGICTRFPRHYPADAQSTIRYGNLDKLLALSVKEDELRTLLRVLAGAGEGGGACLLQLCSRFEAAIGSGGGIRGDVMGQNGGAAGDALLSTLPIQQLYQFLYRSFLSLHMLGDAGG